MRAVAPVLALAVVAALPLVPLTGCSHRPAVTAAYAPAVELPDLHKASLEQRWQRQIHLDPGEFIKDIWRVGKSVYVESSESRITRIDAATGVLKWSQSLGKENSDIYKPIELKNEDGTPSNNVLVVTRGEAFTFSMETGDEVKPPQRLGVSVSADPLVLGNTLIVGGADTLYGLYLDRPDLRRWVVKERGDFFSSPPAALANNVIAASRRGKLARISADSGDWDWKDRKTNGPVYAGVYVDNDAVYVACMDQRVYAFHSDSGGQLWETQLAGWLETIPSAAGPAIIVISRTTGAYALSRSSGVILWRAPEVWKVLASEDNSVWVADEEGKIRSLAVSDGATLASAPATGVSVYVSNPTDSSVILSTAAGLVGMYVREQKKSQLE